MSAIADVFERQVAAFNARDLEQFLETYADAATVATFARPPMNGKADLRPHYARRFQEPILLCEIVRAEEFGGKWLVAHERITTTAGTSDVLGVFEIRDGLITRASMMRP
jgi:hypothetical protein